MSEHVTAVNDEVDAGEELALVSAGQFDGFFQPARFETQAGAAVEVLQDAVGEGEEARPLGTLGVIGPTRMNYSKVISLVDFTAQLVSGVIAKR